MRVSLADQPISTAIADANGPPVGRVGGDADEERLVGKRRAEVQLQVEAVIGERLDTAGGAVDDFGDGNSAMRSGRTAASAALP